MKVKAIWDLPKQRRLSKIYKNWTTATAEIKKFVDDHAPLPKGVILIVHDAEDAISAAIRKAKGRGRSPRSS